MPERGFNLQRYKDRDTRESITEDELLQIIDPDKNKENERKPSVILLKWFKDELFSIINAPSENFDQPLSDNTLVEYIKPLLDRYQSIGNVFNFVSAFNLLSSNIKMAFEDRSLTRDEKVKVILENLNQYVDTALKSFMEYLDAEKIKPYRKNNPNPFPIDPATLPLSLFSLTDSQMKMMATYMHDLGNIFSGVASQLSLSAKEEGPYSNVKDRRNVIDRAQTVFIKMIRFHDRFDLDTLSSRLQIARLQDFRAAVQAELKPTRNGNVTQSYNDKIEETLTELLIRESGDPSTKPYLPELSSYFSDFFVFSLLDNIDQNIQRINENEQKISHIHVDVRCELREKIVGYSARKPREDGLPHEEIDPQMTIRESGQEKGVWITLTIQDDGVGFPKKDDDKIFIINGIKARMHTLVYGTSTQKGLGIGLARTKEEVGEAMGEFLTYTDEENGGAVIKASFPLLKEIDDMPFLFKKS